MSNYEAVPQRSHGHSEVCQKYHFSDVLNLQPGVPHCSATHGEPDVTLLFETGHVRYCSGSLQFCVNSMTFLKQRSLVCGILLFWKILRSELLFITPVTSTLRSMAGLCRLASEYEMSGTSSSEREHINPQSALPKVHSLSTGWHCASSFNFQHRLVSFRSPSSCLRLHPRLCVRSILPSEQCFRRQFPCQMWQIQLAILFYCM